MKLLKSKIAWIAVIVAAVDIAALVAVIYPATAVVASLVGGILIIVLRGLQGTELKLGGKRIKL